VWEAFEAERASLVRNTGPFDGFHAVPAAVSKTCLVRFDGNKYSVSASAVGRPVEVRAYAERIELRQDGRVVGEHRRVFGRGSGDDGGARWAAAASLVETCKLNGVDPQRYFTDVLPRLVNGWPNSRIMNSCRGTGSPADATDRQARPSGPRRAPKAKRLAE
jgi:hypothetical protein